MICANTFWMIGFLWWISCSIVTALSVIKLKDDTQQIMIINITYGLLFWLNSPFLIKLFEGVCK